MEEFIKSDLEFEEENGYIIFADGYDDNGYKVSKQVYTTYKSKCDELTRENKQLKENLIYEKNFWRENNKILEQSQNQKENEILKKVVGFINELAWHDVKYDAFQSTMGEFPASPSAIPRYAKKYFDLWKEMFNENLEDEIKKLGAK